MESSFLACVDCGLVGSFRTYIVSCDCFCFCLTEDIEMPGLKRTVYEFCPKCGERDAKRRDDGMIAWALHRCKFGYQGRPHEPPHLDMPDSVDFVRNTVTPEEDEEDDDPQSDCHDCGEDTCVCNDQA